MLCGHAWNLCAPPMASNTACPGFRPLAIVRLLPRPLDHSDIQVICVIETQSASLFFKLLRAQAFERCLCGHRHEDGEWNRAVGQD